MPGKIRKQIQIQIQTLQRLLVEATEVAATAAELTEVTATTGELTEVTAIAAEASEVAASTEVTAADSEVGVKTAVTSEVAVEVAAEAVGVAAMPPDNNNCADPVLVRLRNSLLRMSDAQLLHGPQFLNEAVLSFYMSYLNEIKYKLHSIYMFVTPELSQCLPHMDKKQQETVLIEEYFALCKSFMFFAVNDGLPDQRKGNYWSLLVASRPNQCFYHFASYSGNNMENALELFKSIKDVVRMPEAIFCVMNCIKHRKDYDCSIHVICMVDHLVDYVARNGSMTCVKPFPHKVTHDKRTMLIELIASLSKLDKH